MGCSSVGAAVAARAAVGLIGEEAAYHHRLLQAALAHVGLVQQVLHDLEQQAGLIIIQRRQARRGIGVGAEDDALDRA